MIKIGRRYFSFAKDFPNLQNEVT